MDISFSLKGGIKLHIEQANNLEEFEKIISKYLENARKNFFRGQLSKFNNISSSLSRDKGYTLNEHLLYSESKEIKKNDFCSFKEPIEFLAKMQHYGIPTRLIDFTTDYLKALFFAVQDIEDESDGIVYLFCKDAYSIKDKRVKLLSLLASIDSNNFETEYIKDIYYKQYNEIITTDEILDFSSQSIFIEDSSILEENNERLVCQNGTFAICGNKVVGNNITKDILNIDIEKAKVVIKIPFEYKEKIKESLDKKYKINDTEIYPELASLAPYLKERYKFKNKDLQKCYEIFSDKDTSPCNKKRISIEILLKRSLTQEEIKIIIEDVVEPLKKDYFSVWVYVAKDKDCLITYNWIVYCEWTKNYDDRKDDKGYIWNWSEGYSVFKDYYEKSFEDDDKLYCKYMSCFNKVKIYCEDLINEMETDKIYEKIEKYQRYLKNYFLEFTNFGLCRNDLSDERKQWQINKNMESARNSYNRIKKGENFWKENLKINN